MKPEYQAMIAGIPLLPASEQQEIFDTIRSIMFQQIEAGLSALTVGLENVPIDKRVGKYVKLRGARAASNKDADNLDRAFKGAMETIEKSLIAAAHEQGVTGFKTEAGTTYLDEQLRASIADENAFYSFVRESGDLDFFERRLKSTHIKDWSEQNGGLMPPGLNIFRELTMKVRQK